MAQRSDVCVRVCVSEQKVVYVRIALSRLAKSRGSNNSAPSNVKPASRSKWLQAVGKGIAVSLNNFSIAFLALSLWLHLLDPAEPIADSQWMHTIIRRPSFERGHCANNCEENSEALRWV